MNFGTVVDIMDPRKLGRVKVRVFSLHDRIQTKDLGWSQVLMPANVPARLGVGASVNLLVGTLVSCESLDILEQEFIVTGTLPTMSDVTTDDDTAIGGTEAATTNEPDNNPRVRGEPNPHGTDKEGLYQPLSAYAPEYPYNNVMETESGHVKEYDDTPGLERIMERHKSGTQYEIQPNGSKIEKIVRDNYTLIIGHDTLEVTGNVKIYVSGDANIAVAKDLTAQVGNDMTTIVDGNADLLVKGDIDGEVRGNIDINVGPSDPEHIIYNADDVAVHHVKLGGYTRNKAIDIWFPPVKTDTFTLTHRNMRKVKEMSATAQEPYATALATFVDYDPDKVKLVDGSWTYPDKTSYIASFGNIDLHTEGGLSATIGGEVDMTAFQSVKLDIRKNADIDVVGNINIDATGEESIIDVNATGNISATSVEGNITVTTTDTSKKITLAGNVDITENLNVAKNVVVTGTTKTSDSQLLDGHNHVISGGSSAGNTGNLS